MRKDEVPHDDGFLDGFRRGTLAVDEAGKIALVPTSGWSVETTATAVALQEQDREVRRAWERARDRRVSALAYHAARRQMPVALLAQYMKINRWRVLWHLRPYGFAHMPLGIALRYAAILNLSLDELVRLPDAPERLLEGEHA